MLLDRHGPVGFVDGPAVVGVGSSLTPNAENDATTDPEIIAGWSGSTYWNPRWSPIRRREPQAEGAPQRATISTLDAALA